MLLACQNKNKKVATKFSNFGILCCALPVQPQDEQMKQSLWGIHLLDIAILCWLSFGDVAKPSSSLYLGQGDLLNMHESESVRNDFFANIVFLHTVDTLPDSVYNFHTILDFQGFSSF